MNIKKLSLSLVILACFVNFTHAAKENLSSGIKELIPGPLLNSYGKEVDKKVLQEKQLAYISPHIGVRPVVDSLPN